jgi:hypothetical protein
MVEVLLTTRIASSKGSRPMPPTATRPDASPNGNGQAADDGASDEPEMETFDVPADLTALDDDELTTLAGQIERAMAVAADIESPTAAQVDYVLQLRSAKDAVAADQKRREDDAADRLAKFRAALGQNGPTAGDQGTEGGDDGETVSDDGGDQSGDGGGDSGEGADAPSGDAAVTDRPALTISFPKTDAPKLNPTLADIDAARRADGYDTGLEDRRPEVVIVAAADVPDRASGERLRTMEDLVDACIRRSRALGVTQGAPAFTPLASLQRTFDLTVDERMHPDAVRENFENLIRPHVVNAQSFEALIAAGGWCAPSEIRYDFFRISEVAGLIDLPTFGVNRGGIRWPQSLSLADFFALSGAPASGLATNATMPWQWTEADDIAATGSSPRKVCLRPPCPGFDEARLRAFGICVLAGNLTMDAFPELIRHFIAQTMVAHARVMNRNHILQMVAGSTATNPSGTATESPTTHILGGYELNAIDYRERHGMAPTAVLEGVLPSWVRGVMRSDLAKRNALDGIEGLRVADAQLMQFFDSRYIRMQWVSDWQTRLATGIAPVSGTPPTDWPTSVQGLLYAPGTWGRGNGMRLDLGVVRDSVLNAANDHTAAWSEEATLVAKFGHESRVITFENLVANGHSGQQTAMTGP